MFWLNTQIWSSKDTWDIKLALKDFGHQFSPLMYLWTSIWSQIQLDQIDIQNLWQTNLMHHASFEE